MLCFLAKETLHGSCYTSCQSFQVLIAASLEPYGSRRMLPCFDFPVYKANFSISIQAPKDLIARSNMPEASEQPGLEPETIVHSFETSPRMSTYLIGVTVGHMVSTSATSGTGKNISVWSVPALEEQHSVALQVINPAFTVCRMSGVLAKALYLCIHSRHDVRKDNQCCVELLDACRGGANICIHVVSLALISNCFTYCDFLLTAAQNADFRYPSKHLLHTHHEYPEVARLLPSACSHGLVQLQMHHVKCLSHGA